MFEIKNLQALDLKTYNCYINLNLFFNLLVITKLKSIILGNNNTIIIKNKNKVLIKILDNVQVKDFIFLLKHSILHVFS